MAILNNSNAISSGGYDINNSLRFRASASAYLNRTFGSTYTDKTKSTVSFWVKRGSLNVTNGHSIMWYNASGASGHITFAGAGAGGSLVNDCLYIGNRNATTGSGDYGLQTTQLFRDPSAWYHIVLSIDTTQATSSNRIKLYVNGSQITSFVSASYPSLNYQTTAFLGGNSAAHIIGYGATTGATEYFDGYLTEFNFIDGQALTPSSFGETDTTTGSWKPKAYTGTYGTNGFYLKFSDIATTSGSNAGLGKDFSGNTNYWTTNNISVTAGTTYDAMIDSPTLTSATVANYAVMSPIDFISANGTISSANLNWASSTNVCGNRATIGSNSGKWYWEAVGSSVTSGTVGGRFAFTGSDTIAVEQDKFGMYWHPNSGISRIVNGTDTNVTSAYTYTNGDVLALALDLDNNISYWYKNGVLQYTYDFSSFSTIGARIFFPYAWNGSSGTPSWVYNFGQRPFAYTPRTNHVRLNTYNLPDSTIKKGNTVMDATLYTGTGSSLAVVNAAGFKPDLVYIANRVNAKNKPIFDSVRGVNQYLYTNSTSADLNIGGGLTAFNSNGFTVGGNSDTGDTVAMVGWQWQAGQGTTSSNTSGTITSTVSVNATAGFSVVTYSGTNSASTIGHGLGVTPKFILVKTRSGTENWNVYHASLGNGSNALIYLNLTNAVVTGVGTWNSTAPTSSVFSVTGNNLGVNQSGQTYVAYCWAEIAGYSKAFSYTGNGSADGSFVYTGFLPRFVMIKRTDTTGDWYMWDTARNTFDVITNTLLANSNAAETSATSIDALSNGFKLRNTTAGFNASGGTYIGMAWASSPFKNSNAF